MLLSLLFSTLFGCLAATADPCQDYCDYICNCHAGEDGYDCSECKTTLANPDTETQDQCETDLQTLQDEDDASEHVCSADASNQNDTAAE